MIRLFFFSLLLVLTCPIFAANSGQSYQVDMIVFARDEPTLPATTDATPLLLPTQQASVLLKRPEDETGQPFYLLPHSASLLKREYWALKQSPHYKVLCHYAWRQPSSNQKAVVLPAVDSNGWHMEGTLRIRQSNYFLLDSELMLSPENSHQAAFLFSQKQRLKEGAVYYLDHPQAGMIITVQKVA